MRAITLFGGKFTGIRKIGQLTASRLGRRMVQDRDVINRACDLYPITVRQVQKVLDNKTPIARQSSPGKLQVIAALKRTLSMMVEKEPAVHCGFLGQLIPSELSVRVLLTAGLPYRSESVLREEGISGQQGMQRIRREDEELYRWTEFLQESENWRLEDFNLHILSENVSSEQAFQSIVKALEEKTIRPSEEEVAIRNFQLATNVEYTLARKGLNIGARADGRNIDLTIRNHVTFLHRFQSRVKKIVAAIPEVREVQVGVSAQFYRADIWRNLEFHLHPGAQFERIERSYRTIYNELSENGLSFRERRPEAQQRLWT